MDAPEADFDVKLQKASGDLIDEFDRFLPAFVRRPDDGAGGGSRVRSRVRAREVHWATNSVSSLSLSHSFPPSPLGFRLVAYTG